MKKSPSFVTVVVSIVMSLAIMAWLVPKIATAYPAAFPAIYDAMNQDGNEPAPPADNERSDSKPANLTAVNADSIVTPQPDLNNFTELPTVTDESYWRLVRQGKAKPCSDLAEQYFDQDSDLIGSYDQLVSFPHLSQQDIVNDDYAVTDYDGNTVFYQAYFAVYDNDAEPGTILSEIAFDSGRILISVPELSGELAEFVASRGDSCIMIYEEYDDHYDAVLCFYQEATYVYVHYSPNYDVFYAYAGASLCSQVRWDLVSFSDDVPRDDICIERQSFSSRNGYFDPASGEYSRYYDPGQYQAGVIYQDQEWYDHYVKEYADRDDIVVQFSEQAAVFTETSYVPSSAQMQLLKELLVEFESRPLPEELLS